MARSATELDPRDVLETPPARRRLRAPMSIGLNLTSMIDVVFLLLVYFMVATDFRKAEEIYTLDLPERAEGMSVDPFELDEEPLLVLVRTSGSAGDSYRLGLDGPWDPVQDFQALYEFLRARQVDGMGGGLFGTDHPIVIIPDATVHWEYTIDAFNSAVRAGYVNVTLKEISS